MDRLHKSSPARLTITILLLASSTLAADGKPSLWHISIWNSPAPPADQGPAFSRNATRNMSLLPIQACCIVAAYLFSVLTFGMALLLVGRRLRRAAEASGSTLGVEMVKRAVALPFESSPLTPSKPGFEASPVSIETRTTATWPSPDKQSVGDNFSWPNGHRQQGSVVTFDKSVIENDMAQREQELERLYAAVMDFDQQRAVGNTPSPGGNTATTHLPTLGSLQPPPPPPKIAVPKPPVRKHAKSNSRTSRLSRQSSMASTSSKRKGSVRGLTISSPISAVSSSDGYSPYVSGDESDLIPLRPPSSPPVPHLQRLHHASASSTLPPPPPPSQPGVIAQPELPKRSLGSPLEQSWSLPSSGDRKPANSSSGSTRPRQTMQTSQRRTPSNSSLGKATGPSNLRSQTHQSAQNAYSVPAQSQPQSQFQPRTQPQPQPQPQSRTQHPPQLQVPPRSHTLQTSPHAQSLHPSHTSYPQSQAPAPPQPILRLPPRVASRDKIPMPLSLQPSSSSSSSSSSLQAAPAEYTSPPRPPQALRPSQPSTTRAPPASSATNPTFHLPLRSTSSTDTWTTKTTVVESTRPLPGAFHPLGAGARTPGIGANGLLSPNGGVPATPYSPYMPFTPLTPVTPRLVTRAERKQRQREGGRKVAFAEDQVRDERDIW
ncbi:hypothetical protein L228DRAFT_57675 [Xylona heveae TC161]|uniref:Uncharacterized protein n=1 Tax=Xylona heveae (strain CBS 132557 / TC161) TaxID=1328760 RepID=A0A165IGU2_XYLHT|nr:hypothetical protein L228DRAFT_57675 [Xylona heveae TC161]KZF24874.1 hypothetical protein L228DRAFT_57675 [Xylona heveae TC161]